MKDYELPAASKSDELSTWLRCKLSSTDSNSGCATRLRQRLPRTSSVSTVDKTESAERNAEKQSHLPSSVTSCVRCDSAKAAKSTSSLLCTKSIKCARLWRARE